MKPKTNRNFKGLLGQITSTINTVQFNNNLAITIIVTDNGLSLFDECGAECAHLCPQQEWGESKMYTPGT